MILDRHGMNSIVALQYEVRCIAQQEQGKYCGKCEAKASLVSSLRVWARRPQNSR